MNATPPGAEFAPGGVVSESSVRFLRTDQTLRMRHLNYRILRILPLSSIE
jgi:hypothetical protein